MGTTGSSCWWVGQTSDLFLTFFCLFGCFGGGNSTSAPVRGAGQGWAEPASGAWEGSGRTSHSTGLHPVININPFSFIARALFISTTGIEARVTMTTAMATEKVWRHRGWVTARMHTSQGGRVLSQAVVSVGPSVTRFKHWFLLWWHWQQHDNDSYLHGKI